MKRIGLLCLAAVLALGTLGVGYAAWWDDAEIVQVVQTGYLELGVRGEASLWGDEKDVATLDVVHGEHKFDKNDDSFHQSVTVSVGNLYPCVWVCEYFYIAAGGTVPMHLDVELTFDGDPEVYDFMWIEGYIKFPNPDKEDHVFKGWARAELAEIVDQLQDYQIYGCEVIEIKLYKHIAQPKGDDMGKNMDKTGSFTLYVKGVQYNMS